MGSGEAADSPAVAARILPLIDLTSLNDDDTTATIVGLCRRAVTPFGKVAAVCIYPRFVAQARALLRDTGVRVATVANFPHAEGLPPEVAAEVEAALAAGADEVDVVVPYFRGRHPSPVTVMKHARRACRGKTLKVILETGLIDSNAAMVKIARLAIDDGADFLKTSTGKVVPGATPQAAEILLSVIREHQLKSAKTIGFKAAGGIRTVAQAKVYLDLAERIMGPDYVQPATFRLGASALLDDVLTALAYAPPRKALSSY